MVDPIVLRREALGQGRIKKHAPRRTDAPRRPCV